MTTPRLAARPPIVILMALLLVLNGIGSLTEAVTFALLGRVGVVAAVISGVLGLMLLWRACAIWTFRRVVWFVTVGLLSAKAVIALFDVSYHPALVSAWVNLVLVTAVLLCLMQPRVRELFLHHQADQEA